LAPPGYLPQSWTGTRKADVFAPACMQHASWSLHAGRDGSGSERRFSRFPIDLPKVSPIELFLDDASSHMHGEQTKLLAKVNGLTIPLRVFSIGSGVFLLVLVDMWLYQGLNAVQ